MANQLPTTNINVLGPLPDEEAMTWDRNVHCGVTLGSTSSHERQRSPVPAIDETHLICQDFEALQLARERGAHPFEPMQIEASTLTALANPNGTSSPGHAYTQAQQETEEAATEQPTPQATTGSCMAQREEQDHALALAEDTTLTTAAHNAVGNFIDAVTRPALELQQPLPPTTPSTRTAKRGAATTTLRRNRRIADGGRQGPALQRAQSVLMRKLGLTKENEQITAKVKDAYARFFEHPLSPPQLAALAAIFGWTIPANEEARSAELLR